MSEFEMLVRQRGLRIAAFLATIVLLIFGRNTEALVVALLYIGLR